MQALLIAARALHFAAAISLAGTLGFACLIAEPAFRRSGTNDASVGELRRRLDWIAWASRALALISGTAWLGAVAWRGVTGGSRPGGVIHGPEEADP